MVEKPYFLPLQCHISLILTEVFWLQILHAVLFLQKQDHQGNLKHKIPILNSRNEIAVEKRWQRKVELLAPIGNTQSQICVFSKQMQPNYMRTDTI